MTRAQEFMQWALDSEYAHVVEEQLKTVQGRMSEKAFREALNEYGRLADELGPTWNSNQRQRVWDAVRRWTGSGSNTIPPDSDRFPVLIARYELYDLTLAGSDRAWAWRDEPKTLEQQDEQSDRQARALSFRLSAPALRDFLEALPVHLGRAQTPELKRRLERIYSMLKVQQDFELNLEHLQWPAQEAAQAHLRRMRQARSFRLLKQSRLLSEEAQRFLTRDLLNLRLNNADGESNDELNIDGHLSLLIPAGMADPDQVAAALGSCWMSPWQRFVFREDEIDWQKQVTLTPAALATLRRYRVYLEELPSYYDRSGLNRLTFLDGIHQPEVNVGEAWADALLRSLESQSERTRRAWGSLLRFASTAKGSSPKKRWLQKAGIHLQDVGVQQFSSVLSSIFPSLTHRRSLSCFDWHPEPIQEMDEFNTRILKGLLWMVPLANAHFPPRVLVPVIQAATRKLPGKGIRAPKVSTAAIYALGQMNSDASIAALAQLENVVRHSGTRSAVQMAIRQAAVSRNLNPDEIAELTVPTLNLEDGCWVQELDDVRGTLQVDAQGKVSLHWERAGKPLKTPPAFLKKEFPEQLRSLKEAQKDAQAALAAAASRLDRWMIEDREWAAPAWRERYLDHPLLRAVARRVIWNVNSTATLFYGDELRDLNGQVVPVPQEAKVKLWHPIDYQVAEVLAWRQHLETLGVQQPFKQAWREVYRLTDAERRTGTYSNRFAGHILRQHRFNALADRRGWNASVQMYLDTVNSSITCRPLSTVTACFDAQGLTPERGGDIASSSAAFLYLRSDQVRFYPPGHEVSIDTLAGSTWVDDGLPLESIPSKTFSETMRDIDLFVGVASVGNDPTWQDGGPGGHFREYWQDYSFGELSETAKTRAEYLKHLLPRLKIKDQLALNGRFLTVNGKLRSYKIHLGSSNILMEPNDEYLCIVPEGSDDIEVAFDTDRVLSLILSKAVLLADDSKITDPVILNQIRG